MCGSRSSAYGPRSCAYAERTCLCVERRARSTHREYSFAGSGLTRSGAASCRFQLLKPHRQVQAIGNRDFSVGALGIVSDSELHPVHLAVELALAVIGRNQRPVLGADVAGFVSGEDRGLGHFNASRANRRSIQEQRDVAAFGRTGAVVSELHPHLMATFWQRRITRCVEVLHAEEVVAILQT